MTKYVPGILILDDNKTYGRTENKKRLLYRCIPDDRDLPAYLVPYDLKLGFSKDLKNKFVLIEPALGSIVETIGDVSDLPSYYEYQLYRRDIHESITEFTNKTRQLFRGSPENQLLANILENPSYQIVRRPDARVITIDPNGSKDLDDGFSIRKSDSNIVTMSIYIANVAVWFDTYGLWNDLRRVSTIYLPDKRRTMLPTILSENLCSLLEKKERIALCMDVDINEHGTVIGKPRFSNTLINVHKNYSYESTTLLENSQYKLALEITKKLKPDIVDSHEFIEFWMVYMNSQCGAHLAEHGVGIYRMAENRPTLNFDNRNTQHFFNNVNCSYSLNCKARHSVMDIESYAHITSPIRRLVDLINQTLFMNILTGMPDHTRVWCDQINTINEKMKAIRRTQNDCEIMEKCYANRDMSDEGYLFDKQLCDGKYKFNVYLENLRLISTVKTDKELDNYSKHTFRIFLFTDESDKNRKIRLDFCKK
jgi:exoribonuclease R